jgi:hypothetical protein
MTELVNDNGVDREATPEEAAEIAAERAEATREIEEKEAAKLVARQAVADKLGLTVEEVAALIA